MKKTILVLLVLVLCFVGIAPSVAIARTDGFFEILQCDVPGFFNYACLIAWLMDLWVDPLNGTPR